MRYLLFLSTLLLITQNCFAQNPENWHRVKVYANNQEIQLLGEHGVAVDHGKKKQDTWIISDFSDSDLQIMRDLGLAYEVILQDIDAFYKMQSEKPHQHNGAQNFGSHGIRERMFRGVCDGNGSGIIDYPTPSNFSLGSLGGYFTYNEFIQNLDQMANLYPNLITVKQEIDSSGVNYQTHDGNPIYYVKISDNPSVDENEPEVLYTSIHHSREPASLSQTIFYMWYLLENYGTDDEATYLVDNLEMYFIPMINPDGYIHNEGLGVGGMWRKNRRNNGGGEYGVDLNRNYSYQYGVSGVSSNPSADNYLGPNAFSEPETRAIRQFTFDHDIRIAQNAHTYGNLLLYPFGYDNVQTADHTLFQTWSSHMVEQSGFSNILSANLYPAAGDSDDWMYADDLADKPKIYAMTPEVGADAHGFWPAQSEITPICKGMVFQNLRAAHLCYIYGLATDIEASSVSALTGYLNFNVQRYGLEPGTLTVSITPVGTELTSVGGSKSFNFANVLDSQEDSISYVLDAGMTLGQEFTYVLTIDNGFYSMSDTLTKTYGSGTVIFSDDATTSTEWTGSWSTTGAEFVSPSTSWTDSPGGDYGNNDEEENILNTDIDLTSATAAVVSFYAMWEIEDNYDYVQLQASTDNGSTWTPLCGKYTNTGTSDQDFGQPLWDGFQTDWVLEEVDLADYLGQTISLRFVLVSDVWVTEDGFYYDDFTVSTIGGADGIEENNLNLGELTPNPASVYTYIPFEQLNEDVTVNVYDQMGKLVLSEIIPSGAMQYKLNIENLSAGTYFCRINASNKVSESKKLVVLR